VAPPYYGRVAGPLTRTVADAARAMAVISQADERDHMSLPPQPLEWDALAGEVTGLRIGLVPNAGAGLPVDPEITDAVASAAAALDRAGAHVEPVEPLITEDMLSGLDRFWRMRSYRDWIRLPPERRDRVLPYLRAWMEPAAGFTGTEVFDGFSQMDAMSIAVRDAIGELDVLLAPVAPIAAFAAELPSPAGDPARALEHIAFTVPFNMSGHPAISVPSGRQREVKGAAASRRGSAQMRPPWASTIRRQVARPIPLPSCSPPPRLNISKIALSLGSRSRCRAPRRPSRRRRLARTR
jgi:aspartyl-tRNA(Asn)/glutamyl-tRNA(Gln) amidotransferase subunit A